MRSISFFCKGTLIKKYVSILYSFGRAESVNEMFYILCQVFKKNEVQISETRFNFNLFREI